MITFIDAVQILCADYQQVARSATRRLAQATKRKPVLPIYVHAIGIATMRKPWRHVINRRKKAA